MEIEAIRNFATYNERMKKSLLDKIFFMDKVDARTIVDFGCGDGTLIHFMSSLFPEFNYIGYDHNELMIDEAIKKIKTKDNIMFTSDIREVKRFSPKGETALILSSLIHEIYSYSDEDEIRDFWSTVFNGPWKYIIIRDMAYSAAYERLYPLEEVYKEIVNSEYSQYFFDFLEKSGIMADGILNRELSAKDTIHFLLKYRYTDNWEREARENYLPLSVEKLEGIVPLTFDIIFKEHFTLPFIRREVKKDFGKDLLQEKTHVKMILEKK